MQALSIGAIESGRMPVPGPLIAAYEAAHYVVFGEPDIVMKVGEKNAQIDALLEARGAGRAAFVSAANPRGLRRRLAENVVAFHTLRNVLRKSRYLVYEGEGRDRRARGGPRAACSCSASRARTPRRSAGASDRTRSSTSRKAARRSWCCCARLAVWPTPTPSTASRTASQT